MSGEENYTHKNWDRTTNVDNDTLLNEWKLAIGSGQWDMSTIKGLNVEKKPNFAY